MQVISILGVTAFFMLTAKKFMICKGYLYFNAFKLMLLVSDIYRNVPIWISDISGDISSFMLIGTLKSDSVILRKNCIWNILDIDSSQIKVLIKNKAIRLLPVVPIQWIHKCKVRRIMNKSTLGFHMMIKKVTHGFHYYLKNK